MKRHLSKMFKKSKHGKEKVIKVLHGGLRNFKRVYISSRFEHMFEPDVFDDFFQSFEKDFDEDLLCKPLKPSQFRFN